MNLRTKFLAPTAALVIVCIAVLSIAVYRTTVTLLENSVSANMQQLSSVLTSQVGLWIQDTLACAQANVNRKSFVALATGGGNNPAEVSAANQALGEITAAFKACQRLNIVDTKGRVIACSIPEGVGVNIGDREYFKQALATGQPVISDALASKADGKPVFTCTVPMKQGDKIVGAIMGVIGVDFFAEKLISPLVVGKTGYALVIGKDGRFIAHKNPDFILKRGVNDYDWARKMHEQKQGILEYALDGRDKFSAFSTDPVSGWTVAVTAYTDDIMGDSLVIRNYMIWGGILTTFVLCLGLAWLVARLVISPLDVLTDFLERSSKGDTSRNHAHDKAAQVMYQRTDEIGKITRAGGSLRKYMETKITEAQAIAGGDFTGSVSIASPNDALGNAFSEMQIRLNRTLNQVGGMVDLVSSGTQQIAAASQSLSAGATESAASLEEISSSMTEIGAQTRTNAENTGQANHLATESKANTEQAQTDVKQMVNAMSQMQKSGAEIAKIVTLIDDIAFQTNLLSLNAAVEAAHAGKYGKGFAVVAEEVRKLAGRSAKAAQETADLVEKTVGELAGGYDIARRTEVSLQAVVQNVVKVSDLLGEINAASNEQAQAVGQIGKGLQQIDQVIQQNTANAEETSSATCELSSQAGELHTLMRQFTLTSDAVMVTDQDKREQALSYRMNAGDPEFSSHLPVQLVHQQMSQKAKAMLNTSTRMHTVAATASGAGAAPWSRNPPVAKPDTQELARKRAMQIILEEKKKSGDLVVFSEQ